MGFYFGVIMIFLCGMLVGFVQHDNIVSIFGK